MITNQNEDPTRAALVRGVAQRVPGAFAALCAYDGDPPARATKAKAKAWTAADWAADSAGVIQREALARSLARLRAGLPLEPCDGPHLPPDQKAELDRKMGVGGPPVLGVRFDPTSQRQEFGVALSPAEVAARKAAKVA